MSDVKNILLVGVGGQGIILASKILSMGLIAHGYDAKMSEVHGMAQRGGSVTTQVRYGKQVFSPIIGTGQADIIVAFEKMEALRWLEFLRPGGKIVVNDFTIPSVPILTGQATYPENVFETLKKVSSSVTVVDAANIASGLGSIKAQNMVLLGALIKAIGLEDIPWNQVLAENVKERFLQINTIAIEKGKEAV